MTPFFYLNDYKGGIAAYYPEANKFSSKIKSKKRSTFKDVDNNSNRSKSVKSKQSSKSKDSKNSKREENPFKRKNFREPNLYTSPQIYPIRQNLRDNLDNNNKSLSKGKNTFLKMNITTNRSPLKFNKLTSAKSTGALKATEYIR